MQRSTGSLPEAILARTVEISRDEAETLLAEWRKRAAVRQTQMTAGAVRPPEPDRSAAPIAAAGSPTTYRPGVPPRSRRSGRLLIGAGAVAVAIAIIVLAVLATTGNLGTGAKASTGSTGSTDAAASSTTAVAAEDLVATVGGRPISRQQLDQKIADFESEYASQIPDKNDSPDQYKLFQEDVLDYLVAYELVGQKAATLAITVTDQDVDTEMALILKVSFGGDQAKFDAGVKEQGLTMDQFRRIYRESMLFNKVYAEVTKGVTVPDTETQSTLLEAKQGEVWSDWLAQARLSAGVTYTNGWAAPANGGTLVP